MKGNRPIRDCNLLRVYERKNGAEITFSNRSVFLIVKRSVLERKQEVDFLKKSLIK